MTPKEKSIELIEKFRKELSWIEKEYNVDLWRDAQQCAIICVEETIEAVLSIIGSQPHFWKDGEKETHEYWQSVLNHLKQ